jgi:hypothetical protein
MCYVTNTLLPVFQTIIVLIVCIYFAMDGYLLWVDELSVATVDDRRFWKFGIA